MQKQQALSFRQIFKNCFANNEYDSKKNQTQLIQEIKALKLKQVEANEFIDSFYEVIKANSANATVIQFCQDAMKLFMEQHFQKKPLIQKALFFPSEESEQEMINYLNKTTKTLDICVFTITNNHFANAIFLLFHKGVKVRIITDDEQAKSLGADIEDLAKSGIPIRTDDDARSHMHNKFAIIDSLVLINGSFNWTMQAATKNQENVTVLENAILIQQYEQEFEKLWKVKLNQFQINCAQQFKNTQVQVDKELPVRFKKLLH